MQYHNKVSFGEPGRCALCGPGPRTSQPVSEQFMQHRAVPSEELAHQREAELRETYEGTLQARLLALHAELEDFYAQQHVRDPHDERVDDDTPEGARR